MTDEPTLFLSTTDPAVDDLSPVLRPHRVRTRFFVAFLIGIMAVLAVGVGALYAYDRQFVGRILPGVRIGSVDLSGLSPDEAASRLHAAYDYVGAGKATLVIGTSRLTLDYASFSRRPDVDAMVLRAINVGRGGNAVEQAIANTRTALRGVTIAPIVQHDQDALERAVAALAASKQVTAKDATITATKTGFTVSDGATGKQADPAPAVAILTRTLASLDAPAEITIELPLVEVQPQVTTSEATAARAAAERIAADVKIVDGKKSWTIAAATVRSWINFRQAGGGNIEPIVDTTKIKPALGTMAKSVASIATNASFKIAGIKVVGVIPAAEGRALDQDATAARIGSLLATRAAGGAGGTVAPVLKTTEPNLTTAEAQAAAPKMKMISQWTTYFPISERNHFGANIWIPALDIDGTVVGPGEVFDFWNAIGPISAARGYGAGGAIINGKTEPQGALAGGICSCSTTLFNAALRAGLKMGARRNHFYYIDRYPIGLDATVFKSGSGSTQTMSWTNDTAFPVLVRGYKIRSGNRGYVRFEIYSEPNGRIVKIGPPTIKNLRPSSDTVVYTTSLAPGARKRVEYPVDGKDVWRTVTVYENGKIIHQTTYYSHYARITGITLVGRAASTN